MGLVSRAFRRRELRRGLLSIVFLLTLLLPQGAMAQTYQLTALSMTCEGLLTYSYNLSEPLTVRFDMLGMRGSVMDSHLGVVLPAGSGTSTFQFSFSERWPMYSSPYLEGSISWSSTGDPDWSTYDQWTSARAGYDPSIGEDASIAPGCDVAPLTDSDGDGVDDALDICPGGDDTMDTDGDGTPDFCDATPTGGTPGGGNPGGSAPKNNGTPNNPGPPKNPGPPNKK